ncbi:MAG TPA: sigma-70 family RNA polymerase sigma factor [Gemmatimonadaceae bacterium]|nr:sigma-70 family RNA polymerase sigma factor [Gemmatimonadaceae bacterium]
MANAIAFAAAPSPDNVTLRAWWGDDQWDRLAPVLQRVARDSALPFLHAQGEDVIDDVVQATLIRCWRLTLVPDHPTHFARRVSANLARDYYKRADVYRRDAAHVDDISDVPGAGQRRDALEQMIGADSLAELRAAIRVLPSLTRRCLVLFYWHKRSVVELMATFALSEGAVKMRLVRGRRVLADVLRSDVMQRAAEQHAVAPTPEPRLQSAPTTSAVAVRTRTGRPRVHRCKCGDRACRVYTEPTTEQTHRASLEQAETRAMARGAV